LKVAISGKQVGNQRSFDILLYLSLLAHGFRMQPGARRLAERKSRQEWFGEMSHMPLNIHSGIGDPPLHIIGLPVADTVRLARANAVVMAHDRLNQSLFECLERGAVSG